MKRIYLAILTIVSITASLSAAEPTYWQDIRPVFRKHCIVCHSAKNLKEVDVSGGVAFDSYEATTNGTKHLVERLKIADEDKRMPKDASPLPEDKIKLLENWLAAGMKEGDRPVAEANAPSPTT